MIGEHLIREQVTLLTGQRFLGDYASDEAQYMALMTNGLTYAKQFNLRPECMWTSSPVTWTAAAACWRRCEPQPEHRSTPNFAKTDRPPRMTTMNISLPDALKNFVDAQVADRGYGTSSEYVRELIRGDQDRQHLRGLLLAGASSQPTQAADGSYFDGLRSRVRKSQRT